MSFLIVSAPLQSAYPKLKTGIPFSEMFDLYSSGEILTAAESHITMAVRSAIMQNAFKDLRKEHAMNNVATIESGKSHKTNHRVTQPQFYALCKWLENKANVEGVKTYKEVSARAQAAFPDVNCYDDAIKRAWITVGYKPLVPVLETFTRDEEMEQMRAAIRTLAIYLAKLSSEVHGNIPDEVAALTNFGA